MLWPQYLALTGMAAGAPWLAIARFRKMTALWWKDSSTTGRPPSQCGRPATSTLRLAYIAVMVTDGPARLINLTIVTIVAGRYHMVRHSLPARRAEGE